MIRFAEQLSQVIAALPPRNDHARQLAPSLAYGRHRGPAPANTRRAAVAIAILERADGSRFIPLTARPRSLKHHGGQVSLPGGKVEPGESDLQAAKREFNEELGLSIGEAFCCGMLPPLYVYASENLISPMVLVGDAPRETWQPDLLEVDKVIELPLEVLMSDQSIDWVLRQRAVKQVDKEIDTLIFQAAAFHYQNQLIWGATAILLGDVAHLLRLISSSR